MEREWLIFSLFPLYLNPASSYFKYISLWNISILIFTFPNLSRVSSFSCHLWQDFECWLLHVWFWEFSWSRNVALCHKPSSNQSMTWPDSSSVFWLFSILLYKLVASLKFLSTSSTTLSIPLEGPGCPEDEYKLYLQKFLKVVSI